MIKIVSDNNMYAKVVKITKNRKEMTDDLVTQIEEVVMDSAKAQAVVDASKSSMGMDISPIDLINIQMFASRVIDMFDYRKRLHEYLHNKIDQVAPNLSGLIGDQVSIQIYRQTKNSFKLNPLLLKGCRSIDLACRKFDQFG